MTAADILRVSASVQKIERLAQLDHLSSELLDPEFQPVEQLLRDPMCCCRFLIPPRIREKRRRRRRSGRKFRRRPPAELSEKSQHALVEYVRHGGTLFVFPHRPAGEVIAELWKDAAPSSDSEPSDIGLLQMGVRQRPRDRVFEGFLFVD